MSDGFKRFIETGGKTLEEIRKNISKALNEAVDYVVDDAAEFISKELRTVRDTARKDADGYYMPEKIPPRRPSIDYSTGRPQGEPRRTITPNEIAFPREPLPEHMSQQDEYMLDKIREMRALEEVTHNNYIVRRCAEITMVRQGLFMADVEDDYDRRVFCAISRPIYAAMSNSQLRTYFTWRTDVRRGKYAEVDKPYILLYCSELLNKIGVPSADAAFEALLALWNGCRGFAGYLDKIIPRWLKDFYAYNDITAKFPDIPACLNETPRSELGSAAEEIERGVYSNKLDFLADNSVYNIRGSIFLTEDTAPLLNGACEAVLGALSEYFEERGIELSELLCGKLKKDYTWVPFYGALVDLDRMDGFRAVTVDPSERYCIKRGEPALECFEFSPSKGFIGYLLKSTEAELRKKTGFKRYITPNISMLENDFKNRTKLMAAVSDAEFPRAISSAVDKFCIKNGIAPPKKARKKSESTEIVYTREKVEIDVSQLEKIREQSDELAKKLMITEDSFPLEDEIEQIAMQIADDDFDERVSVCGELAPEVSEPEITGGNSLFEQLPESWQSFANDLTPTQLTVLKLLQNGGAADYCRENGLLPETLFEEINNEALAALDDIVVEGGKIIPDYSDDIAKIIAAAGI